jgi:hypothetical protein
MGWQRVAMTTIDGDDEEGRGQVGEVKGGVTVTVMSGLGKRPTFGGGGALSRIRNAALRRPCESDARAQHACGTVARQAQQVRGELRGPKGHTVEASADVQLKQLLPAAACWNRRSASRPEADSNFASPNQ